jgi:hypothetical protein
MGSFELRPTGQIDEWKAKINLFGGVILEKAKVWVRFVMCNKELAVILNKTL